MFDQAFQHLVKTKICSKQPFFVEKCFIVYYNFKTLKIFVII